ncbi:MAG: hypothetical protein ACOYL5_13375 [Phototrophicaceae bacterium]
MRRQTFIATATLILLAAATLRLYGLHTYPPGPHYDEAVNVIVIRSIAYGGARPFPMIENYQGREVLYHYLGLPFMVYIYDGRFALQLLNVCCNLLLVASTIQLGRRMFGGRRGALIGLAAGVVAAISLPQVWLARQSFRAVTLPMMQGLALIFLWRGLQARRWSWVWLIIGGLFAGGAVYTYNSSRLFPIWLALGGLALIGFSARERIKRLRQGAVFFGVLALVALPFVIYAFVRPDVFFGRLYEVTGGQNDISLPESLRRHALMFFWQGETLLRYNPVGRPYFTPLEGVFLLVGLAVTLRGIFQQRSSALIRAAYVLLILSPLMIVPSVISTSGFPPNHMRSVAMVPLIFIAVAVGAEAVIQAIAKWGGAVGRAFARPYGLLYVALGVGVFITARDYSAWVTRADLYYQTDADLAAAGEWLTDQPADTPVYVAAADRYHPTLEIFDTPPIRWLGTDTLFLPAAAPRLTIFPHSAPPPDDLRGWLSGVEAVPVDEIPHAPDGAPAFEAFWLTPDTALPDQLLPSAQTVSNGLLEFVAGANSGGYPNGETSLTTAWRVIQPIPHGDFTPQLRVTDALGNVILRGESFSVGTDHWDVGEVVLQRIPRLQIPIGTPPGDYRIEMTWVAPSQGRYYPFSSDGQPAGLWITVGNFNIGRPSAYPPPAELPIEVRQPTPITDGLTLEGWNRPPDTARAGELLPLTLYWAAGAVPPANDITYTLQLTDANGAAIPLEASAPLLAEQPPSTWLSGQLMTERPQLRLPRELPNGGYTLQLTTSDTITVSLGRVEIQGEPRLFDAPPMTHSLEAVFGGQIALVGYDLVEQGEQLQLRLLWRALQPIDQSYTVFVHLLDADGQIIQQKDVIPRNNTYSTLLWVSDEYIVDEYLFNKSPAIRDINIGLYSQQTGQRLALSNDETQITLPANR